MELIEVVHYGGLVLFALGVLLTFKATTEKWAQRAAYLVAAPGFVMAWGGGQIASMSVWEREMFSLVNVVGFVLLVVLMNLVHRRAAQGMKGKKSEEKAKLISLKNFGYVEGASLILLMFVAMPLKYVGDIDVMVRYVGMVHGILFMYFVGWVFYAAFMEKWSPEKVFGALAVSVIPFAPFVAEVGE